MNQNLGKIPRLIITSIGGFLSRLKIFRADWVAWEKIQWSGWKKKKASKHTKKGAKFRQINLKLLVTIWTLDAILYLFDGEQGRLLVLLQGAERRRFTRRSDLESHLKAKSSSGPTFLLLDSMSSFLFFRSSTDTCAIHHIRD